MQRAVWRRQQEWPSSRSGQASDDGRAVPLLEMGRPTATRGTKLLPYSTSIWTRFHVGHLVRRFAPRQEQTPTPVSTTANIASATRWRGRATGQVPTRSGSARRPQADGNDAKSRSKPCDEIWVLAAVAETIPQPANYRSHDPSCFLLRLVGSNPRRRCDTAL